jgi:hypothetical protein
MYIHMRVNVGSIFIVKREKSGGCNPFNRYGRLSIV